MKAIMHVFTIDGEVYSSMGSRATEEEINSMRRVFEKIKEMGYLKIWVSGNTEMYFHPDKIIGVQIQKQEG